MENYCKKQCVSTCVFLSEGSTIGAGQAFNGGQGGSSVGSSVSGNGISSGEISGSLVSTASSNNLNNNSNSIYVKVRCLEKGVRVAEKKFSLNDFLLSTNWIIENFPLPNPFNSLVPNNFPFHTNNPTTTTGQNQVNLTNNLTNYAEAINYCVTNYPPKNTVHSGSTSNTGSNSSQSSSKSTNAFSQLNITILHENSGKQQQQTANRKKYEAQILPKIGQVLSLFSSRTRVELIGIDSPDNVIQCLASGLHLEADEASFSSNWTQCLEKLSNTRFKKQLISFKLDEVIRELRYVECSKVFIFYSLKTNQFKLIVIP